MLLHTAAEEVLTGLANSHMVRQDMLHLRLTPLHHTMLRRTWRRHTLSLLTLHRHTPHQRTLRQHTVHQPTLHQHTLEPQAES